MDVSPTLLRNMTLNEILSVADRSDDTLVKILADNLEQRSRDEWYIEDLEKSVGDLEQELRTVSKERDALVNLLGELGIDFDLEGLVDG